MSAEHEAELNVGWLDVLLGCTVTASYAVCVEVDGVLEDTAILLLQTSKGVLQMHDYVHDNGRGPGARFVADLHSPVTMVDYDGAVLRTRATFEVHEPFEVVEVQYLQLLGRGEYHDVCAFLLDAAKAMRLAVWVYGDEAYCAPPETIWRFVPKFASRHEGWRVQHHKRPPPG